MEKRLNSYYSLGADDLLYAESLYDTMKSKGKFNGVASLCSQSCEKLLKSLLEDKSDYTIMSSHNLKKLIKELKRYYPDCRLDEKEYKWLGDFYFETRYPGDDFTVVSEDEAVECLVLTNKLKEWVDNIDKQKEDKESKLTKLKDIDIV